MTQGYTKHVTKGKKMNVRIKGVSFLSQVQYISSKRASADIISSCHAIEESSKDHRFVGLFLGRTNHSRPTMSGS